MRKTLFLALMLALLIGVVSVPASGATSGAGATAAVSPTAVLATGPDCVSVIAMSSAKKPPVYPANCPHCSQNSGWPFSAGTCDRPGVIVVKLRCGRCGHEWIADAPQSAMATVSLWPTRNVREPRRRLA